MKPIVFEDLILFEDENYILINKPPDVSSLDERDDSRSNILKLARQYSPDAQLCHRLDKETSGVLAIAKNQDSYRHLSILFQEREVVKVYHAVLNGVHRYEQVEVNQPIHAGSRGTVRIDYEEGKPSVTLFDTLQLFKKNTLVACRPLTGRMHQIRIHLAWLKTPIVADETYGGKHLFLSQLKPGYKLGYYDEEQPLIKRVALHAYSLAFDDQNGKTIAVAASYPKDMRALLSQLEKNM